MDNKIKTTMLGKTGHYYDLTIEADGNRLCIQRTLGSGDAFKEANTQAFQAAVDLIGAGIELMRLRGMGDQHTLDGIRHALDMHLHESELGYIGERLTNDHHASY